MAVLHKDLEMAPIVKLQYKMDNGTVTTHDVKVYYEVDQGKRQITVVKKLRVGGMDYCLSLKTCLLPREARPTNKHSSTRASEGGAHALHAPLEVEGDKIATWPRRSSGSILQETQCQGRSPSPSPGPGSSPNEEAHARIARRERTAVSIADEITQFYCKEARN